MKMHVIRLGFLVSASLILMATMNAMAQAPNLCGKVLLKTPSGTGVMRDATVEIIAPASRNVLHRTYTDSRGCFAFYSVPNGTYEIRVLLGKRVLKQQAGNRLIETLPVHVSDQLTKVPDILIAE